MIKLFPQTLIVAGIVSGGLFSCASSSDTTQDNMNVNEAQTMASDTTGTEAHTGASIDSSARDVDYSQMYTSVANTAQFDLVTLAKMDPNLSTFATLVEQAELSDALMQREEPFTVFAPTNQAFAQWPQDSLNTLMKTENKAQLIKLLQAHLLPGKVNSAGFNSSQRLETGGGEYIMVDIADSGSGVTIGGASIVKADVDASNGVLHVVDKVIAPIVDTIDQF
ncbi:fasciclin domain-containing protein [Pontibacter anaerobius]|uniref:Fasciclin domain-containing protein n=1 Tax=Pontibacter anaerobius TaxID=2993940 RepID=A0ABT3RD00_9BACT|nr:fasciclin domain-containing protein [Pontibacter anaerobius]MCX2739709.1 fasciclin domain-containing protein [Pontibacter anaerobius]